MELMLNIYETVTLLLALVILLGYLFAFHRDWRVLLLAPVFALALMLSLERASQFLTTDETFTLIDTIYTVPLSPEIEETQWFKAKFRTSTVILAPLAMVRHRFFNNIEILTLQFVFKCLHWFLGFLVLIPIHNVVTRYFLDRRAWLSFSTVFFTTALLLPTNDLALKLFNGDLLSMMLGILGLLLLAVAYREANPTMGLAAVIVAYFAAQDKLIASPVLLLAIGIYTVVVAKNHQRRWLGLLKGVGLAFGVTLLIGFAEAFMLGIMRDGQNLTDYLLTSPEPFASWVWVVFNSFRGQTTSGNLALGVQRIAVVTAISAAAVLVGAVLLLWLERSPWAKLTPTVARWMQITSLVLIPLILLAAIVVTFGFTRALSAERSLAVLLDGYVSPTEFNGRLWFPYVPNLLTYLLSFTGYAYAQMYVNALPTVVWLTAGVIVVALVQQWNADHKPNFIVEVGLLAMLLVPLALALAQVQAIDRRYGNLFLFLLVLILIVKALNLVQVKPRLMHAFSVLFIVGLFAEVWAFRPMLGAFRPVWLNFGPERSSLITLWHADPVWIGYGEEAMLIGEALEADCEQRGAAPCTMWILFVGDWLTSDSDLIQRRSRSDLDTWTYTSSDYYIYNRHAALDGWTIPDVEPVMIIEQRGYVQANIYRGDHLAEVGFRFERLTGAETIDQIR